MLSVSRITDEKSSNQNNKNDVRNGLGNKK